MSFKICSLFLLSFNSFSCTFQVTFIGSLSIRATLEGLLWGAVSVFDEKNCDRHGAIVLERGGKPPNPSLSKVINIISLAVLRGLVLGAAQQDNTGVFPAGLALECRARQVQQGWHPACPGFPVAGWRVWDCLLLQLFLMPSSGVLAGVWDAVCHQCHLYPSIRPSIHPSLHHSIPFFPKP